MRSGDGADAIDVDNAFFAALQAGDHHALDSILADDFVIIDVMSGRVSDRATILDALKSRALQFVEVLRDQDAVSLLQRAGMAVVIGRTTMTMRSGEEAVTAESRYAHVFVKDAERWRLLSAQGTPVLSDPHDPAQGDGR